MKNTEEFGGRGWWKKQNSFKLEIAERRKGSTKWPNNRKVRANELKIYMLSLQFESVSWKKFYFIATERLKTLWSPCQLEKSLCTCLFVYTNPFSNRANHWALINLPEPLIGTPFSSWALNKQTIVSTRLASLLIVKLGRVREGMGGHPTQDEASDSWTAKRAACLCNFMIMHRSLDIWDICLHLAQDRIGCKNWFPANWIFHFFVTQPTKNNNNKKGDKILALLAAKEKYRNV